MGGPRCGAVNGRWRGGVSSLKHVDQILELPHNVIQEIKDQLKQYTSKSKSSKCWNWTGPTFTCNGRPSLNLGTRHLAYRVVYALHHGVRIKQKCILHTCDNPICVRPSHLFIGTTIDNSKDMVSKGRQAWGERNGGAKMTEQTARNILRAIGGRKLYGRRKAMAAKFGVTLHAISSIASGKTWKMLQTPGV